ncbi:uncharacterized protein LOC141786030 [Halichoeres trimaculatus]|uniref:uncharacterized protein LOC141786030 n=1 Tax=Halichoeres trimaculatus TaxID=147232 RepID=UPI003D9DC243
MAEEGSVYELEGLEEQLQTLFCRYSNDELRIDSRPFCSDFCKLVEEHASHWQVPLPQLRILELSLIYFSRAACFFTPNCDHVLHTLSSLALSVFELLLFFDQKDFHEEPLKHFTVTFQECHLVLGRHQNVHLLQVERLVQGGGPWASSVLQAILSESSLPQNEVDGYISSELPVFFELRVRYLLSCERRVSEAVALAKCCSRHPAAGQHLFFLQVYLTWLLKTSQHDRLHREVADLNGKDAIHIICSLECEEKDDFLLALCRAFLSQQLRRGDMFYLCDLVLVWSKLHSQLKTSKQALLEESHQLMLSATNVNSIFPFIRAILQELGEDGVQFCVELCANALESCLPCDVITKSLIYKTIAGLLPNDLEVCRACALLVFFLERSVEAYKMVYLLYMHPDQEYHVDSSPIRNHVRFETLQVLKKDLYFDPEFWNLITLRTNCLKLMSEKVVSAALEEIMEDKWILKYCTKDSSTPMCQKEAPKASHKKRHHKEDSDPASKRLKMGRTRLNSNHTGKKKANQGSRHLIGATSKPLRRSFWQLDRLQDNREVRRTTRLSEKNPPKRRIRTPRWLLEDSGSLEENNARSRMRRHGLKHQKHHQSSVIKRSEVAQMKNNAKHKASTNSHLTAKENNSSKHQKGISLDGVKAASPPQVILELSLPDNELMGTFNEETCNRHRGLPQVLLYKPTVKLPEEQQTSKPVPGKEVVLRSRDPAMFIQQLHCYARRQKGKGNVSNTQGSVSTITRSSVQGSPPKDPQGRLLEKSSAETKVGIVTRTKVKETSEKTPQAQTAKPVLRKTSSGRELSGRAAVEMKDKASADSEATEAPMLDKFLQGKTISSARELCEGSTVEMKVTIASQTLTAAKDSQSQGLDKISKCHKVRETSETTASSEVSQTLTGDRKDIEIEDECGGERAADGVSPQSEDVLKKKEEQAETDKHPVKAKARAQEPLASLTNGLSDTDAANNSPKLSKELKSDPYPEELVTPPNKASTRNSMNDLSALTLVTEMVTEVPPEAIAQDLENQKAPAPEVRASKGSKSGAKPKVSTTSSGPVKELKPCEVRVVQGDIDEELTEDVDAVETEESRLEFSCTFCHKAFKGSRVVAHAMFHYRRDECMFCRMIFKDDLLAMMHLSDHIEKLKRLKDVSDKNTRDQSVSKDMSKSKTSSKAKTTNASPERRSRGRPRKSSVCSESKGATTSPPPGSKRLRSSHKPEESLPVKEEKPVCSKTPAHKVNGHIVQKKKLGRPRKIIQNSGSEVQPLRQEVSQERVRDGAEIQKGVDTNSATSPQGDQEMSRSSGAKTKRAKYKQEKEKESKLREKTCCPVEGCAWFTDLTKNRVALLYHALEDHYGEVKPLELAFRVGNGKCSCCMRVLWSFEHFLHHVERHRLTPRYPCPHQGCTIRFKTGIEMRRHARRHEPLQAACCLPGCSQLFICLWALNLHEREHYGSSSSKLDSNEPTGEKNNETQAGKRQPDDKPKDPTAASTVNKTVSVKAAHKLRRQNTLKCKLRKRGRPSLRTRVQASWSKQEVKESSESHEPQVLKNLSNKDKCEHPSGPNLRLRHMLKKATSLNTQRASSRFKHNIKVRHKVKSKQIKANTNGPKRRGRPPKSKEEVPDENKSTASEKEAEGEKNGRNGDRLRSTVRAAESQDVKPTDQSKPKMSTSKHIKINYVKQKGIHLKNRLNQSNTKTQRSPAVKMKKVKKSSAVSQNQSPSPASGSTKSDTNKKGDVKAKTEVSEEELSQKEQDSKSGDMQVEVKDSPAEEEVKTQPSQNSSVTSVPAESAKAAPGSAEETHVSEEKEKEEKKTPTATSDLVRKHKKLKDPEKKSDKEAVKGRRLKKDERKTPALKKKPKPKPEGSVSVKVENQPKEGASNETCTSSVSSSNETSSTAADKEKTQLVTNEKELKNVDPNKAKRKREDAEEAGTCTQGGGASDVTSTPSVSISHETSAPAADEEKTQLVTNKKTLKNVDPNKVKKTREAGTKIVKKKSKDPSVTSTSKKLKVLKPKVQPAVEVKAEGNTSTEAPQVSAEIRGYSALSQNRQEAAKAAEFKQNLAEYGKRPYTRAPPEVYLDEKYITMPKRRKETLLPPTRSPPPELVKALAAAQRQRCASCFATFGNVEELQRHVQLKNCSELFGFDSDDEGNS